MGEKNVIMKDVEGLLGDLSKCDNRMKLLTWINTYKVKIEKSSESEQEIIDLNKNILYLLKEFGYGFIECKEDYESRDETTQADYLIYRFVSDIYIHGKVSVFIEDKVKKWLIKYYPVYDKTETLPIKKFDLVKFCTKGKKEIHKLFGIELSRLSEESLQKLYIVNMTNDYIYNLIPESTRESYGKSKEEQVLNYVKEHL